MVNYSPPGLVTAFASRARKRESTTRFTRSGTAWRPSCSTTESRSLRCRGFWGQNPAVTLKIYTHCMVTSRPEIGASLARLAGEVDASTEDSEADEDAA